MEVKDLKSNQGNVDLVLQVVDKEEPREFEKFGKKGRVCNAKVKDESGEIKLTLWNEDIDKVNVGDRIHLQNCWCSEYKSEKQLSTGRFGKIEVLETASKEIFSNDPGILQPQPTLDEDADESEQLYSDDIEEEYVG